MDINQDHNHMENTLQSKKRNPLSVVNIIVEKLFGIYDYHMVVPDLIDNDKLLLIYGDNGTGKTTILKLFFYLIATRDKSGYKSKIAEVNFKKFAIKFQNGIEIGAMRDTPSSGSYEYYI